MKQFYFLKLISIFILCVGLECSLKAQGSNSTDYFRIKSDRANMTDASTWESSSDGINWYTATLLPGSSSAGVKIEDSKTLVTTFLDPALASKITWETGSTFQIVGRFDKNYQIPVSNYYNIFWDAQIDKDIKVVTNNNNLTVKNKIQVNNTGEGFLILSNSGLPSLEVDTLVVNNGNILLFDIGGSIININKFFWLKKGYVQTHNNYYNGGDFRVNGNLSIESEGEIFSPDRDRLFPINMYHGERRKDVKMEGKLRSEHIDKFYMTFSHAILKSNVDFSQVRIFGSVELGDFDMIYNKYPRFDTATFYTTGKGRVRIVLNNGDSSRFSLSLGYNLVPVKIKNTGETDTFSVRVEDGYGNLPMHNVNSALNQVWYIDEAKKGGNSVDVTFHFTESSFSPGFKVGVNNYIGHYYNNNWDVQAVPVEKVRIQFYEWYIAELKGITGFSPFAIGNDDSFVNPILPVRFISSNAVIIPNGVQVKWQTADELNISFFELQQSNNGTDFVTIGKVNPGSNKNNEYSLSDYNFSDLSYYRIKVVHFDGTFSYSKNLFIQTNKSGKFTVVPNPAKNNVFFNFNKIEKKGSLKIYNASGILIKNGQLEKGMTNFAFDISHLPAGIYNVLLTCDTNKQQQRFVKL